MSYPHILTPSSLTVMVDGKSVSVLKDNKNFDTCIQYLKDQDWDKLLVSINKAQAITNFGAGRITVENSTLLFEGEPMDSNYIIDRILQFIEEGLDSMPMLNFLDKMMDNPSRKCVKELFGFLEHKNMPLDEDGDFYAYKAVTCEFKDKHTKTIDNSSGVIVKVPRNTVDDRSEHGCSFGLHAGSINYVRNFANGNDKIIIVKINPKDVVSVPEHDTKKLRCCQYKVVDEYNGLLPDTLHEANSSPEDIKDASWVSNFTPEKYSYIQDNKTDEDTDESMCCYCGEEEVYLCPKCICCDECCECDDLNLCIMCNCNDECCMCEDEEWTDGCDCSTCDKHGI